MNPIPLAASAAMLKKRVRYGALGAGVLLLAGAGAVPLTRMQTEAGSAAVNAEAAGNSGELRTSVAELTVGDFTPVVVSEGTVSACDSIAVTAQISGVVKRVAPGFEGSSFVPAGEVVVELDGADCEGAIVTARAQVARTRAACAIEETRGRQAKLNWEELGYRDAPGELVLRIPQLSEARAAVEAAEAQLAKARRDLERTKVRVPFACRVLTRVVSPGQSVSAGTVLGTIIASERAFVRLPVSPQDAALLAFPETTGDTPLDIELITGDATPPRQARIIRTEPQVEAESGSVIAVAAVSDPFGRAGRLAPLRIGQKVSASMRGAGFKDAISLPRAAVDSGNCIRLVSRDSFRLSRRTIRPLWMDNDRVITRGLPRGLLLATSSSAALDAAPDGALVDVIADARSGTR